MKKQEQKPANTKKFENCFNFPLSNFQTEALIRISHFVNNSSKIFLLKGYAGTGKTTMLICIVKYLHQNNISVHLMAPTGRAAKVITEKSGFNAYTIHKSIYSMSDLKEYKTKNNDTFETFKYYFELRTNDDPTNTVYIIDEASMVSNQYSESDFFRFGSGYLLNDLFDYIGLTYSNSRKVLFIGDPAQLPPVNMNFSPALDKKYLQSGFSNIEVEEFVMKDVIRQKEDSGILNNATKIRKSIQSEIYNQIEISKNQKDIQLIKHENLISEYITTCQNKIDKETIIIAHSNFSVKNYNIAIRQHFFSGKHSITKGDRIIVIQNNYAHEIEILNGDFGMFQYVDNLSEERRITLKKEDKKIDVNLSFRNAVIRFDNKNGKTYDVKCKIMENLLDSPKPNLSTEETRALYVDFRVRNKNLKPNTPEFKEAIKSDPYFNCLQVKYGYAVTCHKAQGGEWKNVFIDFKTNMSYFNQFYFRWAYTAITRAKQKLYCLNEPHFGIADNLKHSSETHFTQKNDVIYLKTPGKLIHISKGRPSVKNLFLSICDALKDEQINIDKIDNLQYCERYHFSKNTLSIYLDFWYNKKGEITRVFPQTTIENELKKDLINKLSSLTGKYIFLDNDLNKSELENVKIEFPDDKQFLRDFYREITTKVNSSDIFITGIEHYDYLEKYTFQKGNQKAMIDFYYNGKGKFGKYITKIDINYSDTLTHEIVSIIER